MRAERGGSRRGRGMATSLIAMILIGLLAACGNKLEATPTPEPTPLPTMPPVELAAGAYSGDPLAGGCWTQEQVISAAGERPQWSVPPATVIDPARRYVATVQTTKGAFDIELLAQEAPIAVNNFVCLARAGYFNDTRFHRIFAGFVIQGGDPTGTGSGGPGYQFPNEAPQRTYARGTVAMANAGLDTNGSQFFISLEDLSQTLQPNYTLFGNVVSGIETVDAIAATATTTSPNNPNERSMPLEEVIIQGVTISEQ